MTANPKDKTAFIAAGSQPPISKVERYGWVLLDSPGQFGMVPKESLRVDESYQRDEVLVKVMHIAQNWSWIGCGVLLVARRGKSLFLFDGQHRWSAAMRRADITHLPCMIFETQAAPEEARGFLLSNTNRKPITALQRFKALVVSGDQVAIEANRLVEAIGYEISNRTADACIKCVGSLMRNMRLHPEETRCVFPLLPRLCRGGPIHEIVMDSLIYIEANLPDGVSIAANPWRDRILSLGSEEILRAAQRGATFFVRGGAKAWSSGVLELLNKGRRHRLTLKGGDDGGLPSRNNQVNGVA